jgi:Protein kinase domain
MLFFFFQASRQTRVSCSTQKMENNVDEFLLQKREIKPKDGKSLISMKFAKNLVPTTSPMKVSTIPTDGSTVPMKVSTIPSTIPMDVSTSGSTIPMKAVKKPVVFTMEPLSISPETGTDATNDTTCSSPSLGTRLRRMSFKDRTWSTSKIEIKNRKQSLHTPPSQAQSPAQSFCNSFNRQATFTALADIQEYAIGDEICDYKLISLLGTGSTSQVYLSTTPLKPSYYTSTQPLYNVALKIIKGPTPHSEINIWKDLCHPSILEMIESICLDTTTIIVSELADGGSLLDLVRASLRGIERKRYLEIMVMVMDGIDYLHSLFIIHRDIKLENILMTVTGQVKICDFGLSTKLPSSTLPNSSNNPYSSDINNTLPNSSNNPYSSDINTPHSIKNTLHSSLSRPLKNLVAVGSLHYIPPEHLIPNSTLTPSQSLDIWACGCVFYALVKMVLPFNDEFLPRLQMMIVSGRYEGVEDLESGRVIGGMLCVVDKRWDAKKVLVELKMLLSLICC